MSQIVWITLINQGYVRYTMNFIESMRRNNCMFPLIIYCLDDGSMNAFRSFPNVCCIFANPFMRCQMNKQLTTWKTIDYKRIVFSKLDAIRYTMELPQYKDFLIGYIDTDIIMIKNPTDIILKEFEENPETLVVSQCDEDAIQCKNIKSCPNLCSGVIVFKQSTILKSLLKYSEWDIVNNLTDQHYLTNKFKGMNINYRTIEKSIFLNGSYPGLKGYGMQLIIPQKTIIIHYNYMVGSLKEHNMKKNGMWYIGA